MAGASAVGCQPVEMHSLRDYKQYSGSAHRHRRHRGDNWMQTTCLWPSLECLACKLLPAAAAVLSNADAAPAANAVSWAVSAAACWRSAVRSASFWATCCVMSSLTASHSPHWAATALAMVSSIACGNKTLGRVSFVRVLWRRTGYSRADTCRTLNAPNEHG